MTKLFLKQFIKKEVIRIETSSDITNGIDEEFNVDFLEYIEILKEANPKLTSSQIKQYASKSILDKAFEDLGNSEIKDAKSQIYIHKQLYRMNTRFKKSTKHKDKIKKDIDNQLDLVDLHLIQKYLKNLKFSKSFDISNKGTQINKINNTIDETIITDSIDTNYYDISDDGNSINKYKSSIIDGEISEISEDNSSSILAKKFDDFYNLNLYKIQKEMQRLGVIEKELSIDEIEDILRNPFITYRYLFPSDEFSEEEHEIFKNEFSNNIDLI